MTTELIQPTDRPTRLLQSVLYNRKVVHQLITNGSSKDPIAIEGMQNQINDFNPQEKISLLKGILTTLSAVDEEGKKQNQRDAGLGLLRLVDLTSLTPQEMDNISLHYVKTVYAIDEGCDTFGEIDALLEAGKITAPAVSKSTYRLHVAKAWRTVASRFERDEKQYILDKLQEIKEGIPPSMCIPSNLSEFDKEVEGLAQQGLPNKDIAEELKTTLYKVRGAINRLGTKGINFPRSKDRLSNEQIGLRSTIKDLRNNGMGNIEIARFLDIPVQEVVSQTSWLLRKREIMPIKNSGPRQRGKADMGSV